MLADGEIVRLEPCRTPGSTCSASWSARRARSGSSPRWWCGCCRGPQRVRDAAGRFASTDAAGEAVSAIIAAGVIPAAIEMMDALTHRRPPRRRVHVGLPLDAGAVLLVELDGPAAEVEATLGRVGASSAGRPARAIVRRAEDEDAARGVLAGPQGGVRGDGPDQPRLLRAGRRGPAHAAARDAAPDRASCPSEYGLRVGNVFHAGDGNLHPLVLYDAPVEGEPALAEELASEILNACVEAGGSLTGEHGDRARQGPAHAARCSRRTTCDAMNRLRCGFDPDGLLQPGQGVPDAAAVRRGARPLPRAPAGAGGGGGAVVIEHEAGDLTCTVEAETPMVELQAALAGAGQMLALDPPGDRAADGRRRVRPRRCSGRGRTATGGRAT